MRALLVATLVLALSCAARATSEPFEDLVTSRDGEGYFAADSLALAGVAESFAQDRLDAFFSLSLRFDDGAEFHPREFWSRAGLTARSGESVRASVLAVRRSSDPRTLDELHLSLSGRHSATRVKYSLGTFQLDWGLGLASSSSFGVARAFGRLGQATPGLGKGLYSRPTSHEAGWLFGAGLGRDLGPFDLMLFGSHRPWNARLDSLGATLSGPLDAKSESGFSQRDQVNEQMLGGTLSFRSPHVRVGTLAQTAGYDPPLQTIGGNHRTWSSFLALDYARVACTSEFVRSGNKNAWEAVLSGNAGELAGAVYYLYACPGYFAPRGQSAWSFGEPVENLRLIGMRASLTLGRHEVSGEAQSAESVVATSTISPTAQEFEAIGDWRWYVAGPADVGIRLAHGQREELSNGEIVDRATRCLRFRASWRRAIVWSTRMDVRRENDLNGSRTAAGTYFHLQANRAQGSIRPGGRVAYFNISSAVAPFSIFEPTIRGAYPFALLSGHGRHVAGWIEVDMASIGLRAQVAATNDAKQSGTRFLFGLGLHYKH